MTQPMSRNHGVTLESHLTNLQVYLLGSVEFEAALLLQRRLLYDISGDRTQAALVLCEHPPLITVGRHGSRAHIYYDLDELHHRGWPVRWVNRGGGCWLHMPGQLALYSILPLDPPRLTITQYLQLFGGAIAGVLSDFGVHASLHLTDGGVWAGSRLIAGLGIAVRNWVAYFGGCLNLSPDLEEYRMVRCHPASCEPMTSLDRERRGPVRPTLIRQGLIEHYQNRFGFSRVSLFTSHPLLEGQTHRLRLEG